MTNRSKLSKWRGLAALVRDAVEHGSRAVERVQVETAARPFAILEEIPGVATPAKVVHVVHDLSVAGVHGSIRAVNTVVGKTVELALRAAEDEPAPEKTTAEAQDEPTTDAPDEATEEPPPPPADP